jgi:hypothetical protein
VRPSSTTSSGPPEHMRRRIHAVVEHELGRRGAMSAGSDSLAVAS